MKPLFCSAIKEPFCGALSMSVHLQPTLATDSSLPMISMFQAIRKGWRPPADMTEIEYRLLRDSQDYTDPLVAFAGHMMSWGGKWFAGFARPHKKQRDRIGATGRKIVERVLALPDTQFSVLDYRDIPIAAGDLIYCDPPYAGTTKAYFNNKFDHGEFWNWARYVRSIGAIVVISEYSAPNDFVSFFEYKRPTVMRKNSDTTTTEKLWLCNV
jgi:DNA adenine methylase